MAVSGSDFENEYVRLAGEISLPDAKLRGAIIEEGLSQLTRTRIEFQSRDRAIDLNNIVGKRIVVEMDVDQRTPRKFIGLCVEAECVASSDHFALYTAELRPWLWMLTRTEECRVFQDMTTPDLIKQILSDYGFSGSLKDRLGASYAPRDFCLQYRESDFAFLCRLMEEEGIYYYFTYEGDVETMVLADSPSAHDPSPQSPVDYIDRQATFMGDEGHFFEWTALARVTSGKVTLDDYNFDKPKSDLTSKKSILKGKHRYKDKEIYDYPGLFRESGAGSLHARVRMEAEAVRHKTWRGVGNARRLAAGETFTLRNNPRNGDDSDFLVVSAVHYIQTDTRIDETKPKERVLREGLDLGDDNNDTYRGIFEAIPKMEQFRARLATPWPQISSIQTAVVTGPAGEEIYTDKYGRVRIKFHWDRLGKNDDTSSVWVRTMMPWTGKNWGMIAIPRIGQEVVVQFEEGNPDRPVVVGMLYNAETMPPYALPGNMTQSGVKTNSTKGGNGFNELMFEDKKGDELVRFQSEKNFRQIVKNDAEITVGLEKKDKGDMTLTVHRHLTETLDTGDHTFKVAKGSQFITIKTDQSEKIEGKSDRVVTGNVTETVKQGNVTREVSMGNEANTIKMGNYTLKTSLGKVEIEAMQSITLKVGGSSIVIDQMGVTVKGMMITSDASLMLEQKGLFTNVSAKAFLTLKGAMTMIN